MTCTSFKKINLSEKKNMNSFSHLGKNFFNLFPNKSKDIIFMLDLGRNNYQYEKPLQIITWKKLSMNLGIKWINKAQAFTIIYDYI